MKCYDVTLLDGMVCDNEGTIWIAGDDDRWSYIGDHGACTWDARDELPVEYEPYVKLDKQAQLVIRLGLVALAATRK
ncbi:hypothetical protein Mycsm_04606 [Mycobacterium sp. JS623]|uniref:hypothetical protein n=1 Tax=Mycobacterium sp. JS623 TaxID=212767 RepID=UPI0002A5B2F7|nr:hypothetical protein [Mycobacterium sp. JS623]AGB24840.1 hypothetical protein Mycsm_04606 [Mycobacterium sp. JS623]